MLHEQDRANCTLADTPPAEPDVALPRRGHILVPTKMLLVERPALQLSLDLAAKYRAVITLLHVLPPAALRPVKRGLDAFDYLFESAWSWRSKHAVAVRSPHLLEQARGRLLSFVSRAVPAEARAGVDIRVECRHGDPAREIAQFADQAGVDLVILSSGRRAWRLPFLPAQARRVLRLTRQPVVMVRPDPEHPRCAAPHVSAGAVN